jgi:hypothetical protein
MAAEYIDDTENGSGLYPTKIPGYEDAADIQEALRLYHYGSTTIPTDDNLGTPSGINTKSIAGHLKSLENADIANAAFAASATEDVADDLATEITNRTDSDTNLQTQINNISSTLGLQTTIEEKSSSFTLSLADAGKTLALNTSSGMTLTIPSNASVSIPVGYQFHLLEVGPERTTFTAGSGVLVNSKNSQMFIDTRYGKATLLKIGTNEWVLFGDIYENIADTPYSFTPYSFTPTPGYSFTPYSFTPYSFTPDGGSYSFTPFSFTPPEYSFTPYSFTPFSFTPAPAYGTAYLSYCLDGVATQDTFAVDETNTQVQDINQACAVYNSILSGIGATDISCSTTSMPALPGCSSSYSFTPYSFTPYSFTPYSFTPFSFTPASPDCNDVNTLGQGDCAGCGLVWDANVGECVVPENPYSFTPFSFTPPAGYSFTPYSFTPYSFTPYSFTPFSFTPPATDCNDVNTLGPGDCAGCGLVWDNNVGECVAPAPAAYSFTPYSFTPAGYSFTPYSFTPYSFVPESYSFTPYSFTPYSFTPNTDPCAGITCSGCSVCIDGICFFNMC